MRCSRPQWMIRQLFRIFLVAILSILIIVAVVAFLYTFLFPLLDDRYRKRVNVDIPLPVSIPSKPLQYLVPLTKAPELHIKVPSSTPFKILNVKSSVSSVPRSKCGFHSCFNIYRCGRQRHDHLSVYVYPLQRIFVNGEQIQGTISKEFYQVIDTIVNSPYYVSDPAQACVFVPTIDLLNLRQFTRPNSTVTMKDVHHALQGLEHWGDNGENHLIFSMFPDSDPLTSFSSAAIITSSSFAISSYSVGFHIPFLTLSPNGGPVISTNRTRKIFCIATQGSHLEDLLQEDILVLDSCKHKPRDLAVRCKDSVVYPYPEILTTAEFCVVQDLSHPLLWEVMRAGCIPVILPGLNRLPFDEVIDWSRNAVLLYEHQLPELSSILREVSSNRKQKLKSQIRFTFERYFQTIPHLVSAVLELMKERVFPHSARSVTEWNLNPEISQKVSPIFNPVIASKSPGFTAVVLAYERVQSLFQVIERLGRVSSLAKILVVWNNQRTRPPSESAWPKISKSLKVIQTSSNKMSNRFFLYHEIQTEAVFAIDDDIVMLTTDEINFAFQVWREFPDRLVGFPSRSHIFDNSTSQWKYESEWTNEISMVLTGAAFYHKYWHYAYFHEMPVEIRDHVDAGMNCEDIAMNFLIANRTGKAPIKVTPRKKFKCPTCSNNEMLSADTSHMRERTNCINRYADVYGYMPLEPVEFRADPVLFKVETLPKKLKKFREIGIL